MTRSSCRSIRPTIRLALALTAVVAACGPSSTPEPPLPGPTGGGQTHEPPALRQYLFRLNPQITVPVLPKDEFIRQFGAADHLPKTHEAIVALARHVYNEPPAADDTCGEHDQGRVLAALTNPDVEDHTRAAVDFIVHSAAPSLKKVYTDGHFRFIYTDTDLNPHNNVTVADLKATAKVFNAAWDAYARDFREPKHYDRLGVKTVDVNVYYKSGLYGSTSSYSNAIYLNSRNVARYYCKRNTTPAHELWHRVQYAHGYKSGHTKLKWAIEGTAVWSQKYRGPQIGDWMLRFDTGLRYPYKALDARSYDAIHLWLHLGRRLGDETWMMQQLFAEYAKTVDHARKPFFAALDRVLESNFGPGVDHRWLVESWSQANMVKELKGVKATQTYEEQGLAYRCENNAYGPVKPVTRRATLSYPNACGGTPEVQRRSVTWYGSDYFEVKVAAGAGPINLFFEADQPEFAFAAARVDPSDTLTSLQSSGPKTKAWKISENVGAGAPLRLVLSATAIGAGGKYNFTVKGTGPDNCAKLADTCNLPACVAGKCVKKAKADGTACDDNNPATNNDRCTKGVCAGTP